MIVINRCGNRCIHSKVQRTDTQLEESGVVASASQVGEAVVFGAETVEIVPCIVKSSFTIDDLLHDILGDGAEFGGGACAGKRTGDADVDVEVGYRCGGEPGSVFFYPFC